MNLFPSLKKYGGFNCSPLNLHQMKEKSPIFFLIFQNGKSLHQFINKSRSGYAFPSQWRLKYFIIDNLKYFQCSPCRPSATCTGRPCCWPCRLEWPHGLVVTSRTEESPGTSAGSSPGLGLSSWWVNDHDDRDDYLNVRSILFFL